ncbi:MAG: NUDIX domain-containing protein [Nocardioides sp.]|uniref:NUDIX domain-containing protein n=1 Tax=Nocardioides sp. TaxID=35761 RepID=UPI003F025F53
MVAFACVAVVDPRGRVLMQERDEHARVWPDRWGLPGGNVEAGENGLDCAVRELREETGLEVAPDDLVSLGERDVPLGPGRHERWELFAVRSDVSDDDVACHEGRQMVFIEPDAWPALDTTPAVDQVADLLRGWIDAHPPALGTRRFAGVLLTDPAERLLLQERDEHPAIDPERWGLPGGHVDPGETYADAAVRELEEETGVRLPDGALRLWREFVVDHRAAHGTWDPMQVFVAEVDLTDDDIDCREGRQIVFVDRGRARLLALTSAAAQIVPAFLDRAEGGAGTAP